MFLTLFSVVGETWKEWNEESIYAIDTFPITVCDNLRIPRCRLYQDERYRGYIASKRRYFYDLKVHILVTKDGQPVEFFLTPGSMADVSGLQYFDFDLPDGATIYADRAYNDIDAFRLVWLQPYRFHGRAAIACPHCATRQSERRLFSPHRKRGSSHECRGKNNSDS